MPSGNLTHFLKEHKVDYSVLSHTPAYTAQEIAAVAHVPGREVAKCVMLKVDGKLCMFVGPANCKANLKTLQKILSARNVELAHEYEFEDTFPGCETGAMPPIGELFEVDVYIDDILRYQDEIVFNAGNHSELIKMKYEDFDKLTKPKHVKVH